MGLLNGKDYDMLFQMCLDSWGIENQKDQLREELSELLLALYHFKRGKTTIAHVADEIADVKIMLEQIIYAHKIEPLVKSRIDFKIQRLKEKLEKIP